MKKVLVYETPFADGTKYILTNNKVKETENRRFFTSKPNLIMALTECLNYMGISDWVFLDGHSYNLNQTENLLQGLRAKFAQKA